MNLSERIVLHLTGSMSEWNLRNADVYPQVGLWRELGHTLGLPVEELENEVLTNPDVHWMCHGVKAALAARNALEADAERKAAQAERDALVAKLDAIQPSLEKFYRDHYPTIAGRADILKIEGNIGGAAVWNRVATDLFALRNNTR